MQLFRGRRAGVVPAIDNVPQIVVNTGPNQVRLDEFNRWASPLQNNIVRVVAQNLVTLLGTPQVTLFQEALNADSEYHVAIEVQSFRIDAGRSRDPERGVDGATHEGRQDPDGPHERA